MKVSELIEQLNRYPKELNAHLLDCSDEPICMLIEIDEVSLGSGKDSDTVFITFNRGSTYEAQ